MRTPRIQNTEAIEVYRNMASLPMEATDGKHCAAILTWTR